MNDPVHKHDPASEYFFVEGCFILEMHNSGDDPAVSIARARVEPGLSTRWHLLVDTVERYVIIAGRGTVEVGDSVPVPVSSGDVVLIPADTRQRITNTGSDDLIFHAICSPRFQVDNYRDLAAQADSTRE